MQLPDRGIFSPRFLTGFAGIVGVIGAAASAWADPTTFACNPQHTALFSVPAQPLSALRWSTSVNLEPSGAAAHYGAPVITPGHTVLTPVKLTNGFLVRAFEGPTGRLKYTLTNDYIRPVVSNSWVPVYQPVIARPPSGPRLYYAGAGGTVYYIEDLDSDTPTSPVQFCFYTNLAGYQSNAAAFNKAVIINTPLTADTNGVIFFGFRMETNAPAPFNTTNGGFARIDLSGNATYVLASVAANDPRVTRDSHNCAPALSNDGATLYVAAKDSTTANYAYLLGLDSTTLATKYKVLLRDPRNNNLAGVADISTASPMIAPDDDVFFGVLSNPSAGSRGFMLRFSADLLTRKTPSGFGWDYTGGIVPTNMVPWYRGTSSYLLFAKYNNYAGNGDGDGINKIALLDPNATQIDPHPSATNLVEMREVLTVAGCTPDSSYLSSTYPYAVREWCINAAAVNPANKSVYAPCEDGRLFRWDLAANSLTEAFTTGPGVGQPYIPTVIAPDGTIYTLNGGTLFAVGGFTNMDVRVYSSEPDLRSFVAGQSVTFTAVISNLNASGPVPTGSVTFQDVTYRSLVRTTNILASGVPLANGVASVTTTNLATGSNYLGNHFITAIYSGNGSFQPGSATLVQKVHAKGTTTTLNSAAPALGSPITFTATVTANPASGVKPTGMVSFWDGDNFLVQVPLTTNGIASFTTTNVAFTGPGMTAMYSSDTLHASSSGTLTVTPPNLGGLTLLSNGAFQFAFSNIVGAPFTVLGSTGITLPFSNWDVLGPASETLPGRFQFIDSGATNNAQRFYRVRSP